MSASAATTPATTTGAARGRGRPRGFDEDEVIDALVQLFWEQGFEAASLTDIVEAAGLNKSSLYNAFGSKDELFMRALHRYLDGRADMLTPIRDGDGGLDDLLLLLDLQRQQLRGPAGGRGCMMVNASAELGLRSEQVAAFSARYRDVLRGAVRGPLERAATRGEVDADMVEVYTEMLLAFSMSLSLSARSGAGRGELELQVDSMTRLVESWRLRAG